MDEHQKEHAFALLRASLSAKGLKLSQDIMKLNGTLAELANNFDEYGEWLYWITIMGDPSSAEPWGWQIDGHHLIINYFVLGDQVVMSPVFVGSEPVRAVSGKFKGTVVMQDEQDKGLAFMRSLDEPQRKKAVLSQLKEQNNAVAQAYRDNIDLEYAGLNAATLSNDQKDLLLDIVHAYVGTMDEDMLQLKCMKLKTILITHGLHGLVEQQTTASSITESIAQYFLLSLITRDGSHRFDQRNRHEIIFMRFCVHQMEMITAKIFCGSISSSITRQTSPCSVIRVGCLFEQTTG